MRIGDFTRPERDDANVPADVERELEALDAALRGEEVPAGMEGLEALVSDLREERAEPEPRFEAELDAWAAAGFPRGERPGARAAGGGSGDKPGGFFKRFGPNGPRGWSPIAATAATLVVIGVSLVQIGDFGGGDADQPTVATQADDAGGSAAAPSAQETAEDTAGDLEGALEEAIPDEGGSTDEQSFERDARAVRSFGASALSNDQNRPGISRGRDKRQVERDAELTLAAPADEVPDVTSQVIDVVESANGIVLNSRVTGTDEAARASLELKVPVSALDDTLAELSDLADVKSRSEEAVDITTEFVSAKDRLVGLRAERDSLAARIRAATTDAEVDALQAQLAAINRQIVDAQNELAEVSNRAQLADVSVVITSDGAQAGDDEDEGWSFGDALGDAGRVLEVGAGVALISAAVLLPLAIIGAIAYITVAAMNRRARERALDE